MGGDKMIQYDCWYLSLSLSLPLFCLCVKARVCICEYTYRERVYCAKNTYGFFVQYFPFSVFFWHSLWKCLLVNLNKCHHEACSVQLYWSMWCYLLKSDDIIASDIGVWHHIVHEMILNWVWSPKYQRESIRTSKENQHWSETVGERVISICIVQAKCFLLWIYDQHLVIYC